jgi:hypothetical protein
MIWVWLLFLPLVWSSDIDAWGFQVSGTIYKIANDQQGDLYATGPESRLYESHLLISLGTQEIYPHNYFISKINPVGELLWSTRPASQIETALVVIPNCLTFQDTSAFLAGYSGKLGYIVVSSFHSENGRLQWENKEIVSSNSHMFTTHLISDGTSLYLLGFSGFSKIKPSAMEYQESNDFVMKINATNGDIMWSHTLTLSAQHALSLHPFTSVYSYLSVSEQQQGREPLLYVSGDYHDYTTGGSTPVAQLLFASNGSIYRDVSATATTRDDKILYTETSFNHNSYHTQSAENVHYYGTDQDTLGSYILKNDCPDGYFLEPISETTSVGSHCRGITWSIQPTEDHFLTCSYIYGGVETAGLVVIYLLPLLFSLISSYHSQISILSTCLALFAAISFSSDISYLTSQVFYNLFSFGITFLSFFLPILPYAAYMRTHTRGRTHRKFLTPEDSNLSRCTSLLLYFRHIFFYSYLYCLGYILFLLCLLPHPPLRDILLSYLLTEETGDGVPAAPEDSNAAVGVSSKTLTSSLLFTSISLILFSFLPTLVFQSLNDHLMTFAEPDGVISIVSIVSKSLFMLTLINFIFYSYGTATFSVLWSHIQTITTLSASTLLTFQEMDEEDEGSGGGAVKGGGEVSQAPAAAQKNEIEMYQKRIRDLELQLEQATGGERTARTVGESEDYY